MKQHIQKLSISILLFFCTNVLSAEIATKFVYPVGDKSSPPKTTTIPNGFKISQSFNNSRNYMTGGPDDGWCLYADENNETDCLDYGGKWMYGHTGVDLSSGSCGGVVRATASGEVTTGYQSSGYGNFIRIKHTLPNGKVVFSLYGHLQDSSTKVADGTDVVGGAEIAKVGDTGMGGSCHLHFSIYSENIIMPKDLTIPTGYVYGDEELWVGNTFIPSNTMKYFYDPLLFVDDRNTRYAFMLSCCNILNVITPTYSILTKTMYAKDSSGQILSLQRAADAGWITPYVYFKDSVTSSWGYNTTYKMEEFVLRKNVSYAFRALKSGIAIYFFKPGNNYLEARTRQDMMEYAASNNKFSGLNREMYDTNLTYSAGRARSWMSFDYWNNGWTHTYVNHDYDTNDPLRRWVIYYNPATKSWSNWVAWF